MGVIMTFILLLLILILLVFGIKLAKTHVREIEKINVRMAEQLQIERDIWVKLNNNDKTS